MVTYLEDTLFISLATGACLQFHVSFRSYPTRTLLIRISFVVLEMQSEMVISLSLITYHMLSVIHGHAG